MIILGLGSNIGDMLTHLRNAVRALAQHPAIEVNSLSPVYRSDAMVPDNAPVSWQKVYLNCAVSIATSLDPTALLAVVKKIECDLGRANHQAQWAPRVIDIDILTYADVLMREATLTLPHAGLLLRPFALLPLADIAPHWVHPAKQLTAIELCAAWPSRFDGNTPFRTQQIAQRIDTPQLMGILNVTPDSFSDGGDFTDLEAAERHALAMLADGAALIDVGAESTAPTAQAITPAEEMRRLGPVLKMLQRLRQTHWLPFQLSVDTYHPAVAEFALANGVDWINDVTGLQDPAMQSIVRASNARAIFMHHVTVPVRADQHLPRDADIMQVLLDFAQARLELLLAQGLRTEQLVFDPGIGFGKTAQQSLLILAQCEQFARLGIPILIGHSRKKFHAAFTQHEGKDRDFETTVISTLLAQKPIAYLRVHEIAGHSRALQTLKALTQMANTAK